MFKKQDIDLPVFNGSRKNRPDFDAELVTWVDDLRTEIYRKVNILLDEHSFHPLILDLEHLDEHVSRTPIELAYVGQLMAKAKRKEMETKTLIKNKEAAAYFTYLKGPIGEESESRKKPPQAEIDRYIDQDSEVNTARQTMAELIESIIVLQTYYEALQRKHDMITSMQGKLRDIQRAEMRG